MPRFYISAVGVFGYVLVLNPMMGNTENGTDFGPFESLEELNAFYQGERVPTYQEEGPDMFNPGQSKTYHKFFRKGGPLEWMNPYDWANPQEQPFNEGMVNHFGHGVHEVLLNVENVEKQGPWPTI